MTRQERAIELHNSGFNCAQAVACSLCEEIGVSKEVAFSACEGFGLGMGGMEATCGAVSAVVMLAGFKNSSGNPENTATKGATYKLSRTVVKEFEEKNSTIVCKELKGIETGKMIRSCQDCIRDAVEIAEKILEL